VVPITAIDTSYLRASILRIREGKVERVDVALGCAMIQQSGSVKSWVRRAIRCLLASQAQALKTPGTEESGRGTGAV